MSLVKDGARMAVKSRRDGRWMDVVPMARRASKRRTQDQDKLAACCKPRAKIDYLYAKQAIRRIPHIHISPASSTKIWIVLAASGRQSLRYQASRAALRSVHIRCPSISQHTTSTAIPEYKSEHPNKPPVDRYSSSWRQHVRSDVLSAVRFFRSLSQEELKLELCPCSTSPSNLRYLVRPVSCEMPSQGLYCLSLLQGTNSNIPWGISHSYSTLILRGKASPTRTVTESIHLIMKQSHASARS
jgi:hypothetical protein